MLPSPTRVDVLGVDTALREWGAGPPVVLLHGLPTSGLLWRRAAAKIADPQETGTQCHILIPDLPGFGESADPRAYALADYGRWLAALLRDRVGDTPVHLIGQDFGGLVAAWVTSARPVASLTLISCPLDGVWTWVRATALPGIRVPLYRVFQGALYLRSAVPRSSRGAFMADHLARARSDPQMAQKMEAIARSLGRREALRLRGQIGETPTLCLWGSEDKVFPTARGKETARALARGVYREVPGARQGLPFSHPAEFVLEWRLFVGGNVSLQESGSQSQATNSP